MDTVKRLILQAESKGYKEAAKDQQAVNKSFEDLVRSSKRYGDAMRKADADEKRLLETHKKLIAEFKGDSTILNQMQQAWQKNIESRRQAMVGRFHGEMTGMQKPPGMMRGIAGQAASAFGFRGIGNVIAGGAEAAGPAGEALAGAGIAAGPAAAIAAVVLAVVAATAFLASKIKDAAERMLEMSGDVGNLAKSAKLARGDFEKYAVDSGRTYHYSRAEALQVAQATTGRAGARGMYSVDPAMALGRLGINLSEAGDILGRANRLGTGGAAFREISAIMTRKDLPGRDRVTNVELLHAMTKIYDVESRGGIVIHPHNWRTMADEIAAANAAALKLGLPGLTGERAGQIIASEKDLAFNPQTMIASIMAKRATIDIMQHYGLTAGDRNKDAATYARLREGTFIDPTGQKRDFSKIYTDAVKRMYGEAGLLNEGGVAYKLAGGVGGTFAEAAVAVNAAGETSTADQRTLSQRYADAIAEAQRNATADEKRAKIQADARIKAEKAATTSGAVDLLAAKDLLVATALDAVGTAADKARRSLESFADWMDKEHPMAGAALRMIPVNPVMPINPLGAGDASRQLRNFSGDNSER